MSLDRLELLEVRLGSGKVYLVQALPVSAPQLIVSASPSGGPLDPSGLPSEAGEGAGEGLPMSTPTIRKVASCFRAVVMDHALKRGGLKRFLSSIGPEAGAQQRP